jgi:hypothetical protein
LTYPESQTGKAYWGATSGNKQSFNKVWIVPNKTKILESGLTAYIKTSTMKVMTEFDYLAMQANTPAFEIGNLKSEMSGKNDNNLKSQISNIKSAPAVDAFKNTILPLIEQEVNVGQNFAQLRQVHNAIVLAAWFKKRLKYSIYSQVYIDKKKIAGINSHDAQAVDHIYNQYVEAFKKGVYNYSKYDPKQMSFIANGLKKVFRVVIKAPKSARVWKLPKPLGLL